MMKYIAINLPFDQGGEVESGQRLPAPPPPGLPQAQRRRQVERLRVQGGPRRKAGYFEMKCA